MEVEYVRTAQKEVEEKRAKFTHYYDRYNNHLDSLEVCVWGGGGGGGDVYIYNWYPQMPYLSRSYNAEEVMFYVWFIWEW